MSVKFSQIADGGQYVPATDQILSVRNGTTDVLVDGIVAGPGLSVNHRLAAFAGTGGQTLEDSGVLTSDVATLSGAQTFITGIKKFTNSLLALLGSSTGYTVFTSDNSSATNYAIHVPAANDTMAVLGTAQTITALKTFTNSMFALLGSSTGKTTFTSDNASGTSYTMHVPAANDTLAVLGTAQAITALKTFTNSMLALLGSSTGKTTFTSDNSSGTDYVMHVPAANDTLVTLAAAQALSNKTLTLAAAQVGTFDANGVTPVTVSNANVTAGSTIIFTLKTVGGTVGAYPAIQTITPTTGFTVAATIGDTSTYNYAIIG